MGVVDAGVSDIFSNHANAAYDACNELCFDRLAQRMPNLLCIFVCLSVSYAALTFIIVIFTFCPTQASSKQSWSWTRNSAVSFRTLSRRVTLCVLFFFFFLKKNLLFYFGFKISNLPFFPPLGDHHGRPWQCRGRHFEGQGKPGSHHQPG